MAKRLWVVRAECDKEAPILYVMNADDREDAVNRVAMLRGLRPVLDGVRTFLCDPGQTDDDLKAELKANLGSPRRTYEVVMATPLRIDEDLENSPARDGGIDDEG